jgi:hypothetical protein
VAEIRRLAILPFETWDPQPLSISLMTSQNVLLTRGPIGDYNLPRVETVVIMPTTVEQVHGTLIVGWLDTPRS